MTGEHSFPRVTINVSMNTIITSKLTSTAFTPNFNEALLLIDEPGTVPAQRVLRTIAAQLNDIRLAAPRARPLTPPLAPVFAAR